MAALCQINLKPRSQSTDSEQIISPRAVKPQAVVELHNHERGRQVFKLLGNVAIMCRLISEPASRRLEVARSPIFYLAVDRFANNLDRIALALKLQPEFTE